MVGTVKELGKDWEIVSGKDEERCRWVVILIALLLRLLEKRQLFELPDVYRVQSVGNRFHLLYIVLQFADLERKKNCIFLSLQII